MVLGVVVGLAIGLAVAGTWHLVRIAGVAGAGRLAEDRLGDAQATLAEQAAQLRAASDAAAVAETARAVAVSELALVQRSADEAQARAEEERARLAGTFAELSAHALATNNEQFLALADTRFNEARTAAQGDLDQRQQAIARLLDPLS
jgi:DNA recombination protein RmuC